MTTITITINDDDQRRRAIDAIMRCNLSKPMTLTLKPFQSRRTLPMNAMLWVWHTHMAKHFSRKAGPFTPEDMHELMKHKFLGYENPRVIGKTEIPAQLKSTTRLSKGEMLEFMEKVDAWAADNGCLLPRSEDNDYDKLREAQNG